MAYIINTFNGNQLVVVEDGTVDQTTDIKLIGKNFIWWQVLPLSLFSILNYII